MHTIYIVFELWMKELISERSLQLYVLVTTQLKKLLYKKKAA